MTDDYRLFDEGADGDPTRTLEPIDAEAALITAYLARELSPVQVVAVERRLASDQAFLDASKPIIDAWSAGANRTGRAPLAVDVFPVPLVNREELDAGWQRYVDGVHARQHRTFTRRAHASLRVAAMAGLAAASLFGITRAVAYMTHRTAPPNSLIAPVTLSPGTAAPGPAVGGAGGAAVAPPASIAGSPAADTVAPSPQPCTVAAAQPATGGDPSVAVPRTALVPPNASLAEEPPRPDRPKPAGRGTGGAAGCGGPGGDGSR